MKLQNVIQAIADNNKPELAKGPDMVYQVWEDGEITLQKSGDLLWQRNLHCIYPGGAISVPLDLFPNKYGTHAYIFTDEQGALAVRNAICDY